MLINEASKLTKLTKKAIEYYTLQDLISPSVLQNGYREYSSQDIEKLKKISVLRKLDISTEEIKKILEDTTNSVIQAISVKRELDLKQNITKNSLLQELSNGKSYEEISIKLKSIEKSKTITNKLLDAFPGFYGRYICMHFARFLNEPIKTKTEQAAYETILSFLDNIPELDIPKDLEEYLIENTKHIGTEQISEMLEATKKVSENPDKFLTDNKEMLEQYLDYKKSEEYKNSPICKLLEFMKKFNSSTGYNDIFIPAMKELSSSYAEYYHQMEIANKKLLLQYPEIEQLNIETL